MQTNSRTILTRWPDTEAEVDKLPIHLLCAPMSGTVTTRTGTLLLARTRASEDEHDRQASSVPAVKPRPAAVPVSPEKRKLILTMRLDGASHREMAEECGVSTRTIARILTEEGLTMKRNNKRRIKSVYGKGKPGDRSHRA